MNNIKIDEKERPVSLSFSLSETPVLDKEKFITNIVSKIEYILRNRFSNYEKQIVEYKHGRYNFACPYCGDSHSDAHKKRGNLYIGESIFYKCYNCGKYTSADKLLSDFKVDITTEEINIARSFENRNIRIKGKLNTSFIFDIEELKKYAIPRIEIEKKFNLINVNDSDISIYLKKRCQPSLHRFSWDSIKQQLYIFNLIPNTDLVIGYQIRNFKYKPKYLTFDLLKIYEILEKDINSDVENYNEISTMFGILDVDLNKTITVFEGPLDSFIMKNSIGTCSSNIDLPFDYGDIRYMYDYDDAGISAALKKANDGYSIFLWKKFLNENNINTNGKKMDLSDLVIYSKKNNIKLPKLSNYFSKNKFDIYEL